MIASSCGLWFGGMTPATLRSKGVMPTVTESTSINRVTVRLLKPARSSQGTATRAMTAERYTPSGQVGDLLELNSQKKVLK